MGSNPERSRAKLRKKVYDAEMEQQSMTDGEIVQLALKEPAMFGHIIDRYESPLCRYVARLGVRVHEDQQDVLQDVFIKVYKNLHGFDTSMKFSSWIYRIAHNEAISWFRKRNVRPEGHLVGESEDIINLVKTTEENQEALFDGEINGTVIREALTKLDSKYRDVLVLRFFEHHEYEAISDILEIPIGSVGTLIHRGKQQLKKHISTEHVRL